MTDRPRRRRHRRIPEMWWNDRHLLDHPDNWNVDRDPAPTFTADPVRICHLCGHRSTTHRNGEHR